VPVPCPPFMWPDALVERGPPEDPSILLTGAAGIGNAAALIVAIRISRKMRWDPDFQPGLAGEIYQANRLDEVLETILEELEVVASELEEVLDEGDADAVELATGTYKVIVIQVSSGS
jgi:hypothetical protein